MARYAAIDIGTNSVLLLVAERQQGSNFQPVLEQAEITRLGRGVDATSRLSQQGMEATLDVLTQFANQARSLKVDGMVVSATSAARDAVNGLDFLRAAKERAGVQVEIISGEVEAQLTYLAVYEEFGAGSDSPLVVIDIGGGSTEFIYGREDSPDIAFHKSLNVGSVRLTERWVRSDPPTRSEQENIAASVRASFAELPDPPPNARVVGVAGTVTTLYAIQHAIDPFRAEKVHGGTLLLSELKELSISLCGTPLVLRRQLPGLQPKRADVICAGAVILENALERLGVSACVVSDRGVRWGLLIQRFRGFETR